MKIAKVLAVVLLALAVLLAVAAWMLSRKAPRAGPMQPQQVGQMPSDSATSPAMRYPVVVATRALAPGQRIAEDDLKVAELAAPVAGAALQPQQLLGRTLAVGVAAEQPVLLTQLMAGLALQIEDGQRAVAIAVKEAMAAGHHLQPGDYVDVFFTFEADARASDVQAPTQSRLLLARTRVLAYGAHTVGTVPAPANDTNKAESGNANPPSGNNDKAPTRLGEGAATAVLSVPVEDVQRLTLAERFGHLTLALRHPEDMSVPDESLFAALPTALQPVRMASMEPADVAYAGTRWRDLAQGVGTGAAVIRPAAVPVASPTAAAAAPVVSPASTATPQRTNRQSGSSVQMHKGTQVHTVPY